MRSTAWREAPDQSPAIRIDEYLGISDINETSKTDTARIERLIILYLKVTDSF